ncbi:MAG: dTDP-4-dehydrorhamnose 3,5-epimerase family protein [bacterium]
MQILNVKELSIEGVFVIQCKRTFDERGYFGEVFRKSDFENELLPETIRKSHFLQINESFSFKNTFRGLHFQSNPPQAKCVRCIDGHLIDLALDIRSESKTYGKILAYEIISTPEDEFFEWIWLPHGIAHGTLLLENSKLEYLCTSEWNPETNYEVSIYSADIDWSFCEEKILSRIQTAINNPDLKISPKDKSAKTFNIRK